MAACAAWAASSVASAAPASDQRSLALVVVGWAIVPVNIRSL
jgi:hypothetical protein